MQSGRDAFEREGKFIHPTFLVFVSFLPSLPCLPFLTATTKPTPLTPTGKQQARATHATKCKTTPAKFVELAVKQDDAALAARHAARNNAGKEPRRKGRTSGDQTEATPAAGADAPESSKKARGGKDGRRTTRTGAKVAEETEEAVAVEEEEKDAEAAREDDGAPEDNAGKATESGKEKNKKPEGETSAPGRRQTRKGNTPVREEETSTAPPAQGSPAVKKNTPKKAPAPRKSTTGAATGNETTTPRGAKGRPPKKAPETIRVTDAGAIPVDPIPTPVAAAADANPTPAATATTTTGYSSLKNSELADMLKARGLHYSGNKAALVARLEESDGDGAAVAGVEREQAAAESSKTTGSKQQGGEEVPDSQESAATAAEPTDGGVPDAELLGLDTEGEDGNDDGAETAGKGKRKRKEAGGGKGATESPKKRRN